MEYLEKYPYLKKPIEAMFENRRNEILNQMLEADSKYLELSKKRAKTSHDLLETLDDTQAELFEQYSDSIYAQEIYELDSLYKQAVNDTLNLLHDCGLF